MTDHFDLAAFSAAYLSRFVLALVRVLAAIMLNPMLGSVRVPAAWTHMVGIKPQRGRISTWPDPEAFYGLTCIGPLARTIGDAVSKADGKLRGAVAGAGSCRKLRWPIASQTGAVGGKFEV